MKINYAIIEEVELKTVSGGAVVGPQCRALGHIGDALRRVFVLDTIPDGLMASLVHLKALCGAKQ